MSDWQYDMLGIAQCIVAFGQIVLVVRMNVLENRVCSTLNFILKSLGRTGRTQSTGEEKKVDGDVEADLRAARAFRHSLKSIPLPPDWEVRGFDKDGRLISLRGCSLELPESPSQDAGDR